MERSLAEGRREDVIVTLLRDLASEFQIIYLTASDRYDSAADNVIVLPAPAERR